MFSVWLQILLTAALASCVTGSAISLTSSASSIKPLVSSNLTITCALHDTTPAGPAVGKRSVSWSDDVTTNMDSPRETTALDLANDDTVTQTSDDVLFVTSMVVSRDGVDLATISEHFPVRQLVPGFKVTGHLTSGAGERGSMTLTWPHPTQADAGTYRCDLSTLSAQGHDIVFSQTIQVMEQEVSMTDLVIKLHTIELEKEEMQSKAQDMQLKINELETVNSAQNKTLQEMKTFENQLKANNTVLSMSLKTLRAVARVEPDIFFTAILTAATSYSTNDIVVYNQVVTNQGAAYNNNTGKFTAPVSGYYHFELHAWALGGNYEQIALRHNGNPVVSATKVGDNEAGASNSVMIKLSKADVVDVACTYGTTRLYYDTPHRISNTLSGRLISLH